MTSFLTAKLQRIQLLAILISFITAGFSWGAVIIGFGEDGATRLSPGPATATVTLSDLENDPVTLSTPDQGGPFLPNAANNSFQRNDGFTGEIDLVFQTGTVGAGGLANWDVTIDPNGNINGNNVGWGVATGGGTNSQISGNELLLFTWDTNFTTTGSGDFLFESARLGENSWEIWHRTGPNSGERIIFGTGTGDTAPVNEFVLTDGDMFAMVSTSLNNRLRRLTFELTPEPTTIGLAGLCLAGLVTIVRRRRADPAEHNNS